MTAEPNEPDIDEVAEFQAWLQEKAEREAAAKARRDFATFLVVDHNKGRTHDQLTQQLAELVAAVYDTRKVGTLTLKLTVKPAENVDDMVTCSDAITMSKPEHDRPATMFYASRDGALSKDHPAQQTMFSIQGEQTR